MTLGNCLETRFEAETAALDDDIAWLLSSTEKLARRDHYIEAAERFNQIADKYGLGKSTQAGQAVYHLRQVKSALQDEYVRLYAARALRTPINR